MFPWRGLIHTALVLSLVFFPQTSAFAQTAADTAPALRIKSVFAGPIWRGDVDAGEEYAAVSNSYNSASTWALDLHAEVSTARVPILNEQPKRAHAVALSPSAELIAYSTPPVLIGQGLAYQPGSSRIYIVKRTNGAIIKELDGSDNDIITRPQAIRFAPDGEHFGAVLSSGCGLRVWSTKDWRLVGKYDYSYGGLRGQDRCCRTGRVAECESRPDGNSVLFHQLGELKA